MERETKEIMVGSEVSIISKLHVRKTGQPVKNGTVECEYPTLIIHGEKMDGGTISVPFHILQVHKNTAAPVPTIFVKVNGIETEVLATDDLVKALGIDLHPELAGAYVPPAEPIKTKKEVDKEEKAAEKVYKKEIAKEKKLNKTE